MSKGKGGRLRKDWDENDKLYYNSTTYEYVCIYDLKIYTHIWILELYHNALLLYTHLKKHNKSIINWLT